MKGGAIFAAIARGILLATSVFLYQTISKEYVADVLITNKTDHDIDVITIRVHEYFRRSNIAPHGIQKFRYRVYGDSHFDIEARFRGGRRVAASAGYFTRGFNYEIALRITESRIEFVEIICQSPRYAAANDQCTHARGET